jgi:hypothetical protein
MDDSIWTDERKQAWLDAQQGAPTHVVTFEPMYHVELCIPPWEHTERRIARSAVAWGRRMRHAFEEYSGDSIVVAAHHEGNSIELHDAVTPRPRLHRVS